MKAAELRKLSDEQLQRHILELLHEALKWRMQKDSDGKNLSLHRLKAIRRIVARIKTIRRERLESGKVSC